MLTHIFAAKCIGIDAVKVTVEVDIDRGIGIHLVGLADAAVKESLLRTTTALEAMGYRIPGKKIVINLAPADLRKSGSGYDLPIAIGIIASSGQKELPTISRYLLMGELGLDGSVRSVTGALPFAELAGKMGLKGIILPRASAAEASLLTGVEVYGVSMLEDAVRVLEGSGEEFRIRRPPDMLAKIIARPEVDFCDIVGQECAKRGMEIAAAGGHNIMMVGAPGSGKSSLAKALAGILPLMDEKEMLLTYKIFSVAGKRVSNSGLSRVRPFRSPHHSSSVAAIIGGGGADNIIPGEISLATGGVLFLDEYGQFPRSVTEALRAPLEDRKVVISRLKSKIEFASSFMLVAASNPCPCGYYGEGDRCVCSPAQRLAYLSRLSGPIIDRIDIHVKMSTVPPAKLRQKQKPETSAEVAARVAKARAIQTRRFAAEPISLNAEMSASQLEKYCPLSEACQDTIERIMGRMQLSMRAYHRIIRVARTIADLEGAADICELHIIEAASFRMLDRVASAMR